jgi:hypothetical protein
MPPVLFRSGKLQACFCACTPACPPSSTHIAYTAVNPCACAVHPLQAIRSDNPIIFFEHVLLYNIKGETHDGDYCQSLERAEVRMAALQRSMAALQCSAAAASFSAACAMYVSLQDMISGSRSRSGSRTLMRQQAMELQ